jgi:hypothetical protein
LENPEEIDKLRDIPKLNQEDTNNKQIKNNEIEETPRWRLEGGRKRASYSEILERRWRHTLQAKPPRRGKSLTPPHLQPAKRISTSR